MSRLDYVDIERKREREKEREEERTIDPYVNMYI
jgi:hypothetical protein